MREDVLNRLSAYSLFACVNLILHQSIHGEVIYTNVDPDSILDNSDEFYSLDIDNNGTFDFAFLNTSGTTYDFTLGDITFQSLLAGPMVISNAIAGISHYYFYSGGYRFLPYALASEELIGPPLSWQMAGIQYFAWSTYRGGYDDHCNLCDWANDTLYETFDKYIGIRFSDSDNNLHYGWIRCDVKDYGHTLILKDYAYENEVNYPILAGSKATYQEINSTTLSGDIYASGNIVYINITNRPEIDFAFNVYDMSGRRVYSKVLQTAINTIPLSVPIGIYLIEIHCGDFNLGKTIRIES